MSLDARKARLILSLRRAGITDVRVLESLERVPREAFVPEHFHDQAYEDTALPIGHGQTISQPLVVAGMTQALETGPRVKVLEVGTGSGYQTAVLAHLVRRVYTIETLAPLQKRALDVLERLRITNLTARVGDGGLGWPEQAPFERIIVTAAAPQASLPQPLIDQLAPGGVAVAPVTLRPGAQWVVRFRRAAEGEEISTEKLWQVRFVPLVGEAEKRAASL